MRGTKGGDDEAVQLASASEDEAPQEESEAESIPEPIVVKRPKKSTGVPAKIMTEEERALKLLESNDLDFWFN